MTVYGTPTPAGPGARLRGAGPALGAALTASSLLVALLAALLVTLLTAPADVAQARWGSGASPSGGAAEPVGPPPGPALPASVLARIPTFPAPPEPEPMTIAGGPSAPLLFRVSTTRPVAFITIDDGWHKRPEFVQLIYAAKVPVTLFLTLDAIRDDPGYFARMQAYGADIENHTLTHPNLAGRSYEFQRREICGASERLGSLYGRRPALFRPPFGNTDANTLRAVRACGMKAALYWTQDVDQGVVAYQEGSTAKPGDIFLLHLRPTFVEDLLATLAAIHDAGLVPARLGDYVR